VVTTVHRPASALALLALAASAGCNANFAPQYLVQDLRILAIRSAVVGDASSTPAADAAPGERLRLTALVANPAGRAPLVARWLTCLPTGTDRLPPCLDPALLREPERLAASEGVLLLAEGEGLLAIEEDVPPAVAGALATLVDQAAAEPALQCRLYLELPVVLDVRAGDRRELAVKRVRLVPSPEPFADAYLANRDPALDSARIDSGDGDACGGGDPVAIACSAPAACPGLACDAGGVCGVPFPAGRHTLCGRPGVGSIGTFEQCSPDGARTSFFESLSWQWYATGGTFDGTGSVGNATGASIDFTRPAGPFTIWAIVRDGRGGEAWLQRDIP